MDEITWNAIIPAAYDPNSTTVINQQALYQFFTGDSTAAGYQTALQAFITQQGLPAGTTTLTPAQTNQWITQLSYNLYFPGDTDGTKYQAAFEAFETAAGITPSTPLTSADVANFITQVRQQSDVDAAAALARDPLDLGSESSNYSKTLILNKVYALISEMIDSTQNVAAVQASRLEVLTQWQQAYTNKIGAIHTFTRSDVNAGGGTGSLSDQDIARGSLNTPLNDNYRTQLQTDQSIVSDSSKALQSNLNQSNDAVSQQADMATSIIQELSTILSSIFH